jgi:SOS response regulatory protein OraA/RecX
VLERLAGVGYLDDERVVRQRAARLAERGYGDDGIRLDLERRGAGADLVEEAIAALEPEQTRAERLVRKPRDGLRAARALARKGFSEASVERALEAVAQDTQGRLG